MKVIFISGPYRAKTEWQLVENIRAAEAAAIKLWREGWAVFCAHKNSAHFGGVCDESNFLNGDIEILKRCDAIYMLKSWRASVGACVELEIAMGIDLEIIYEG
ncbi:hypothetical protein LCGC14_0481020 [marine sediment metagenome]|uniref:DUF4406 domain-containing protein n=1 Tax=marine sediment metagenome TaxID=412755 RepID=A0A0F9VI41_9ZZZZ